MIDEIFDISQGFATQKAEFRPKFSSKIKQNFGVKFRLWKTLRREFKQMIWAQSKRNLRKTNGTKFKVPYLNLNKQAQIQNKCLNLSKQWIKRAI